MELDCFRLRQESYGGQVVASAPRNDADSPSPHDDDAPPTVVIPATGSREMGAHTTLPSASAALVSRSSRVPSTASHRAFRDVRNAPLVGWDAWNTQVI